MKDFADVLINKIIENERSRIDKIMKYTTEQVSKDFALVMNRFLDMYYDDYDPTSYVRVYGKRGRYLSGRTKKPGEISLHAAVSRNDGSLERSGGTLQPVGQVSYVGGIEFDESNFKGNKMKHLKRGIEEWDIVQNFLYAGEGVGNGDWRSEIEYSAPSADKMMREYMDGYDPLFDKHYNDALKKFR